MESELVPPRSRERQAAALQAADKRAQDNGKTRTQLAAELNLSYDQYARYVNGTTPFRFEQIDQFAAAYGVDPTALGQAILTGNINRIETPSGAESPAASDFEAALDRLESIIPEHVAQVRAALLDAPALGQRAIIDVLEVAAALEQTAAPRRTIVPQRPNPEDRADYDERRTGA